MERSERSDEYAQLETDYNAAGGVPNVSEYFSSWRDRSSQAREVLRTARDLPYGNSSGQTLDLFLPERMDSPVHVFLHGGYWRSQDKTNFSFMAAPLVAAGAAVVIPNYDLCPAVSIDEIVKQTNSALAWTYRNAPVFGGDPNRIVVSGHSAGAHLAIRAIESDWSEFSIPGDLIKAVVAISGIYDLDPIKRSYLNADLKLTENQARRNSPVHYVPRRRCPLILAVGEDETSGFIEQADQYSRTLNDRGYVSDHVLVPGANHYSILDDALNHDESLGMLMLDTTLKC